MKRKRILSLLLALTVMATMLMAVPLTANANYSDTGSLITWDFAEYTDASSADGEYQGITYVLNNDSIDTISTSGFKVNGGSTSTTRYMKYTPKYNGTLTVNYKSNNSASYNRRVYIGTAVNTTYSTDEEGNVTVADTTIVVGLTTNGSSGNTIQADLSAGTTYYVYFGNGGSTVTSLTYAYTQPNYNVSIGSVSGGNLSLVQDMTTTETFNAKTESNTTYSSGDSIYGGTYFSLAASWEGVTASTSGMKNTSTWNLSASNNSCRGVFIYNAKADGTIIVTWPGLGGTKSGFIALATADDTVTDSSGNYTGYAISELATVKNEGSDPADQTLSYEVKCGQTYMIGGIGTSAYISYVVYSNTEKVESDSLSLNTGDTATIKADSADVVISAVDADGNELTVTQDETNTNYFYVTVPESDVTINAIYDSSDVDTMEYLGTTAFDSAKYYDGDDESATVYGVIRFLQECISTTDVTSYGFYFIDADSGSILPDSLIMSSDTSDLTDGFYADVVAIAEANWDTGIYGKAFVVTSSGDTYYSGSIKGTVDDSKTVSDPTITNPTASLALTTSDLMASVDLTSLMTSTELSNYQNGGVVTVDYDISFVGKDVSNTQFVDVIGAAAPKESTTISDGADTTRIVRTKLNNNWLQLDMEAAEQSGFSGNADIKSETSGYYAQILNVGGKFKSDEETYTYHMNLVIDYSASTVAVTTTKLFDYSYYDSNSGVTYNMILGTDVSAGSGLTLVAYNNYYKAGTAITYNVNNIDVSVASAD